MGLTRGQQIGMGIVCPMKCNLCVMYLVGAGQMNSVVPLISIFDSAFHSIETYVKYMPHLHNTMYIIKWQV